MRQGKKFDEDEGPKIHRTEEKDPFKKYGIDYDLIDGFEDDDEDEEIPNIWYDVVS